MILRWSGVRFELSCSKAEYPLAKAAGFHWDYQKRVAWTGRTDLAKGFAIYADERAKERFNQDQKQIDFSRAANAEDISADEYDVPKPKGKEYLPFQKVGILVMLSRLGFDISKLKKGK